MQQKENVDHPQHYKPGKLEAINIIEHYNLGFRLGNTIKYILRHKSKHETKLKQLEDLKKAKWYLDREIAKLEKKIEKANRTENVLCLSVDHTTKAICLLPKLHTGESHLGYQEGFFNKKLVRWNSEGDKENGYNKRRYSHSTGSAFK